MTRHFKRARGCGPLLIGLVGFWLAGEGASEPFVWVDESGHTHFGHGTAPKGAVADIDGLRSLWDGRVTGHRAPLWRDGEDAVDSRWSEATSDNFRIWLDGRLAEGRAPSPLWTLGALEAARKTTESVLGVVPTRPLRVILYAENTYARLHGARFGFETVGFYDGGIHVVAPADRPDVLRARIHHEYAHAVFRDRVGDDRPYWLNEGWARRFERMLRDQPILTSQERAILRNRVRDGDWIPIRELGESFSSLQREQAQGAYLQSALAVEWLERHTDTRQRRRLLRRLGEGQSVEEALQEATGVDVDELERRLLEGVRATLSDSRPASGS